MGSQKLKLLSLTIHGAVQGVGFRPFVYRLATELELKGWVNNNAQGVAIEVEGNASKLNLFQERLQQEKPARSQIHSMISAWKEPLNYQTFEIRESSNNSHKKTAVILPDIATCDDCLRDIFDAANRAIAILSLTALTVARAIALSAHYLTIATTPQCTTSKCARIAKPNTTIP